MAKTRTNKLLEGILQVFRNLGSSEENVLEENNIETVAKQTGDAETIAIAPELLAALKKVEEEQDEVEAVLFQEEKEKKHETERITTKSTKQPSFNEATLNKMREMQQDREGR